MSTSQAWDQALQSLAEGNDPVPASVASGMFVVGPSGIGVARDILGPVAQEPFRG